MNEATPTIAGGRRMNRSLTSVIATLLLIAPLGGQAQQSHGPHEHGVGQLNIAVEGHTLEIELVAPGADIVGFEHAAASAGDRAALTAATARLEAGAELFTFPAAAGCTLQDAEVESGLLEGMAHDRDHKDEHGHKDKHGHKDEHAHKGEHGHKNEHDHKGEHGHKNEHDHKGEHGHEHEGGEHAEFHAHYHFACTDPGALEYLDTSYFQAFPAARELDVQALTERGQTAVELTPDSTRVRF